MRFNIMHSDHDLLVCTPQYWELYQDAIKRHYPDHEIEVSRMPSHGQAYLFNKKKLREEYEKVVSKSED